MLSVVINIKKVKMNYKEIANQTGLKINHVKRVLKWKRKATIRDIVSIRLVLKTSKTVL